MAGLCIVFLLLHRLSCVVFFFYQFHPPDFTRLTQNSSHLQRSVCGGCCYASDHFFVSFGGRIKMPSHPSSLLFHFCFPVLLFIIPSLTILISTDWKTSNFSSSHISEVSNCMCSRAYHRARHISVFLQMLRSYLRQLARHHILSHTVVLLCTNIK